MPIIIKKPETEKEFKAYYDLRWRVLREPWYQPRGSEKDELEKESFHVMACNENNEVIGVGRLHLNKKSEAQIRYMAVDPDYSGKGIGTLILEALEEKAKQEQCVSIMLHSRDSALNFYRKHQYITTRKSHLLYDAIQHYQMTKTL